MSSIIKFSKVPFYGVKDVLVIGGGSAGCVAALAAAGQAEGKYKVALVERYGFLGGSSTQMLDTFYGFFTPGNHPQKIVGGWPDKVVNALDGYQGIFLRPNTYGAGTGVNYNPERLKLVWDELIVGHDIDVILHATLVGVEPHDEGYACVFWHKGGFFKINALRVIDASGDGDFSHLAGLPYEEAGLKEPAQTMTTTFRMSNVDLEQFEKAGGKPMLKQKMSDAVDKGQYDLPRKEGSAHEMNAKNCISTVAVKVAGYSGLDAMQLTEAEMEGRRQAFVYEKFFRNEVAGYADANIIGMSHQIGVRETRRIYGNHRLTKMECLEAIIPETSIFLCGAPIEDHRQGSQGEMETHWEYIPNAGVYGVPYGTIVPQESQVSWCVGRCFSASHDAHASCRSMAQTMSMGQAAGVAAVLSLSHEESASNLSVSRLRNILSDIGAVLELPDGDADISRHGWKNNF